MIPKWAREEDTWFKFPNGLVEAIYSQMGHPHIILGVGK
jgi:hypothetical protein